MIRYENSGTVVVKEWKNIVHTNPELLKNLNFITGHCGSAKNPNNYVGF